MAVSALRNFEAIARQFGRVLVDVSTINDEGTKGVWRLETDAGPLALKQLDHAEDRCRFFLAAQAHLHARGGRVPELLPTTTGNWCCTVGEARYGLSRWVDGRHPNLGREEELVQVTRTLGEFHRGSEGFSPPPDSHVSTKLGRWPDHYRKMAAELRSWHQRVLAEPESALARACLDVLPEAVVRAEQAVDLLVRSAYQAWVADAARAGTLCHQDFGGSNTLLAADGVWIVDLDNVTFDVPARDLRKLLNKVAVRGGRWDGARMETVLGWYQEANHLTADQLRVLYADLWFPHELYGELKNPFKKGEPVEPGYRRDVLEAAGFGRSKTEVLAPLLGLSF